MGDEIQYGAATMKERRGGRLTIGEWMMAMVVIAVMFLMFTPMMRSWTSADILVLVMLASFVLLSLVSCALVFRMAKRTARGPELWPAAPLAAIFLTAVLFVSLAIVVRLMIRLYQHWFVG